MHVYHACVCTRTRACMCACARACACVRSRTCERADGHTSVRARVYARGEPAFWPMCSPASFGTARRGRRKFHAPAKRDAPATVTRSTHCCVPRPEVRAVSVRSWHAWLASLSWRGFGCSSAAESRPRPSSVAVCYQIGRRCVAFTRQPVGTHPRAHPPQAPVATLGGPS
jgi:hypothetical protein